jgi:Fic family protein
MYRPDFAITNKILRHIGEIEAAKEVIEHAPLLPYWEKKFQDEAILRTTHYGTHIEGNELSLSQVQKVLDGERIVARDRDVQEVINYRKVVAFIGDKKDIPIDEKTILALHKLTVDSILDEHASGEYRKKEVVIRNSITGDVSFRPPPSVEVEWQMKDLVEFIHKEKDIHSVLKAGIVHYEFVRIHPFLDGNGRVGRALSMLVLFAEGYDIREFFSLEEHFDRNAADYYKALQSVAIHNGDVTNWLEYFSECLAIELTKIKEKIERISIDNKMKEKLGGTPVMLTDRQLKIIEYIQEVGYLENKVFANLFPDVSEDTALREVQDLVKKGIIVKRGKTKGVKYLINKE